MSCIACGTLRWTCRRYVLLWQYCCVTSPCQLLMCLSTALFFHGDGGKAEQCEALDSGFPWPVRNMNVRDDSKKLRQRLSIEPRAPSPLSLRASQLFFSQSDTMQCFETSWKNGQIHTIAHLLRTTSTFCIAWSINETVCTAAVGTHDNQLNYRSPAAIPSGSNVACIAGAPYSIAFVS